MPNWKHRRTPDKSITNNRFGFSSGMGEKPFLWHRIFLTQAGSLWYKWHVLRCLFMKDQLYIYDCITGKLRVSDGDFMAIGAGKQNTFRIRTEEESAGVFAQRSGVCRFFPNHKVTDYSINGNRTDGTAHIKPERFYLFVLKGGCFIAWYGNDDSRPDFGNFNADCWYTYNPQQDTWSEEIKLRHLLKNCEQYDEHMLATFYGLDHNAFRISDLKEVAHFVHKIDSQDLEAEEHAKQKASVFRCPFCHKAFQPQQSLAIAAHPLLKGDSVLGESAMKRFTPELYTAEGYALDEMGAICQEFACPECHHKLPPFYEQTKHHRIAVVAPQSAGMGYYLAALVHKLERDLPRDFDIPFRDADPIQNAALNDMRIRVFYSNTPEEFREGRDFLNGKLHSTVWRNNIFEDLPHPFIYTLSRGHTTHSLMFYNAMSADSDKTQDTGAWAMNRDVLKVADAIFYLFDPTQDPSFRDIISDTIKDSYIPSRTVCQQSILLADMEMNLRKALNLPHGTKTHIPIAVILTKSDVWGELLGPEPLLPTVRNRTLKPHNIMANSARLRDLLFRITPEISSKAEAISKRVCYFAVSSFGVQPEIFTDELTDKKFIAPTDGKLTPTHVTDPFMWALHLHDTGVLDDI